MEPSQAMSPDLEALLKSSGWVRSLARSLVADSHSADDLAQDAWVIALQKGVDPQDARGIRRWFAAILRNTARDRWRGDTRRAFREGEVARDAQEGESTEMLERLETHRRVVDAVVALDEPYRGTLLLRYFEELGPNEIAQRTGVPVRTVHSRLNRGLAQLRRKLDVELGEDPGAWLLALLPLSREGGWTSGAITGTLIMHTKLKLALGATAVVGIGWVATLPGRDLAPKGLAAADDSSDAPIQAPLNAVPSRPSRESVAKTREASTESPAVPGAKQEAKQVTARQGPTGLVFDLDGLPVSGIAIERRSEAAGSVYKVETTRSASDSEGRFSFESPGRTLELSIVDERYVSVLMPAPGRSPDIEPSFVIAPRQPLGGMVVDIEGHPLTNANIAIDLPQGFRASFGKKLDQSRVVSLGVRTGEDGGFYLEDSPQMKGAQLVITCAGYPKKTQTLPFEPTNDLEIVLGQSIEGVTLIEGHVVNQEGAPVEGARVAIESSSGRTDATGRFALPLKGAGDLGVLMALKEGSLPARLERSGTSNVAPDAWPDPLVLTLGGAPLSITGRVVDADGAPLANARVWSPDTTYFGAIEADELGPDAMVVATVESLLDPANQEVMETTGEDGSFSLTGLMPNAYRVFVFHAGTLSFHSTDPAEAGTRDLVVTVPREERVSRIAGHVFNRDGTRVSGARVTLCRPMNAENGPQDSIWTDPVRTDEEGSFEFRSVPVSYTYAYLAGHDLMNGNYIELANEVDLERLELTAVRSCRLRVQLTHPEEADRFQLRDADDEIVMLIAHRGNFTQSTFVQSLVDGVSESVLAEDTAVTLILLNGKEEVRRSPVRLSPNGENVLRL